jgi:multidrug resistance efflux pump
MRTVLIVSLLLAAAVVGWLYWRQLQPEPFIVSGFVEADQVRVGSRVGGRVAEVMVDEGSKVEKGQPLFEIDPFDLQEQLAQARATLAVSEAELARLKEGFRREEIEQARARRNQADAVRDKLSAGPRTREIEIARERLNAAKATLELAQTEFQRIAQLREQNQAASVEYDQAQRELKSAQAQAAAAQLELALLEEGSRKEDIAAAEAALAEAEAAMKLMESGYRKEDIAKAVAQVQAAQAQMAAIQERINELTVQSPCSCLVEAIDLEPGDLVAPNAPSVSLIDTSNLWVRTYVPEARLGEIQIGQRVPVRVDSFPDERFTGRISFVAQQAEFTPRNVQTPEERSKQVFRVKVTLEEGVERLRVGMIADVLLDEKAENATSEAVP